VILAMEMDATDSSDISASKETTNVQQSEKESELAKAKQMLDFLIESGITQGQKQVKLKIEKLEEEVLQMSQLGKITKELRQLEDSHKKIVEDLSAKMKKVLEEEADLARRKDLIRKQLKEAEDVFESKQKECRMAASKFKAGCKVDGNISTQVQCPLSVAADRHDKKPASKGKAGCSIDENMINQECSASALSEKDDSKKLRPLSRDTAREDVVDEFSEDGQASLDPLAFRAPHLTTKAEPVEYEIVIPTYQRWQSVSWVTGKRRCLKYRNPERPFILENTLRFLSKEGVPKSRVTLFVASDDELAKYVESLQGSEWADVRVKVSAPGIRDSRNAICKHFSEGTYVVSLDDDISCIYWKVKEGNDSKSLRILPPGSFQKIIFDAYQRMKNSGAFLWGLCTSQNPRNLDLSRVSTRNGLVNGFLHGFIARPKCNELLRSLCDSVEDCEFSVRHFAKDGIVLRYSMYTVSTICYGNAGGLQAKFKDASDRTPRKTSAGDCADASKASETNTCARKLEELQGAADLHKLFPHLIAPPAQKSGKATMSVRFISLPNGCGVDRSRTRGKHSKLKLNFLRKPEKKRVKFNNRMSSDIVKALRDEDTIAYAPNNKLPTSEAFSRYEKYKHAQTLAEAKESGARRIDLQHDAFSGCMKILNLDTTPASSECTLQENDTTVGKAPAIASSKLLTVSVRVKEMRQSLLSLKLPRADLVLLANRCGPSVRSCPANRWGEQNGPLAEISIEIVRILLHWGKTGTLSYSRLSSALLSEALTACGAPEVAMRARCCEVASGQASLARFWPASKIPELTAEASRPKANAFAFGSKPRGKTLPEAETDAKTNIARSLAHYFGNRASVDGTMQ